MNLEGGKGGTVTNERDVHKYLKVDLLGGEIFLRTINRLTFFPRVEGFEFTKIMMEYIIKFHLSNHSSKALEKPQIDCDETTLLILIQNTTRFSLKEEGLSNDFVSLNPQITMRYRDGTKTTPMHYLSVSKDRPTLALANKSD